MKFNIPTTTAAILMVSSFGGVCAHLRGDSNKDIQQDNSNNISSNDVLRRQLLGHDGGTGGCGVHGCHDPPPPNRDPPKITMAPAPTAPPTTPPPAPATTIATTPIIWGRTNTDSMYKPNVRQYAKHVRGDDREQLSYYVKCADEQWGYFPYYEMPWIRPDEGCHDAFLGCDLHTMDGGPGTGGKYGTVCHFSIDSKHCGTASEAVVAVEFVCGGGNSNLVYTDSGYEESTSNRADNNDGKFPSVTVECKQASPEETEGPGGIVTLQTWTNGTSDHCEDKFLGCECLDEGENGSKEGYHRCTAATCHYKADETCRNDDGTKPKFQANAYYRCSYTDDCDEQDEPDNELQDAVTVTMVESKQYPGHVTADIDCGAKIINGQYFAHNTMFEPPASPSLGKGGHALICCAHHTLIDCNLNH